MKNTLGIIFLLIFSIAIVSCKKDAKKPSEKIEVSTDYSLDLNSAKIEWTAYKTTDKIAVKGEFKKVEFTNSKTATKAIDAINGTAFSIPVSSIFSNNEDRDSKLQKFFFGVMDNTTLLTGKIAISNENSGELTISMNAMTQNLPFSYTLIDNTFALKGTMDLEQWNGGKAISSINEACLDKHKAADGISKTWNDVQIDASISIIKK